MTKRAADVQTAYDAWAPLYETDGNPLVALDDDVAPALWPLGTGDALDFGCGTGRHTRRLVARGWNVTGVDVSRGMLDRARAHVGGVTFVLVEPGAPLPIGDARFDLVSCTLVLEHVADLGPPLKEIARVLKPGGTAVITDIHPAMRALTQANFTDPNTGDDVLPPSFPHTLDDYVTAARAAGLALVRADERVGSDALAEKTARARKYVGLPMLLAFVFAKAAP